MNRLIIILLILLVLKVQAGPDTQRYCYPDEPTLTVVVNAPTWEDGKPQAARSCYKALTNGKYPGNDKGLEIIDVCVNPRQCN